MDILGTTPYPDGESPAPCAESAGVCNRAGGLRRHSLTAPSHRRRGRVDSRGRPHREGEPAGGLDAIAAGPLQQMHTF